MPRWWSVRSLRQAQGRLLAPSGLGTTEREEGLRDDTRRHALLKPDAVPSRIGDPFSGESLAKTAAGYDASRIR